MTTYFFTLESTRQDKNPIRVIYNSAGNEAVTQQEIEMAHCDFYRKLYSCEPVDPQIQRDFLSKVDVSLNDEEITLCERALSADEISRAVRGLSQGNFMLNFGINCALFCFNFTILVSIRVFSVHRCKRVSLV